MVKGRNGGMIVVAEKGESGNLNGRPKNYLNQIKDSLELECDVSVNKSTVRSLMSMLAYLPKDKIQLVVSDEKMPIAIRSFCRSIIKDYNLSSTDTVKGLISFEMGNTAPEDKNLTVDDIEPQKILDTSKYLVAMLNMTQLEEFCNWLEEHVDKKRASEAVIINQ